MKSSTTQSRIMVRFRSSRGYGLLVILLRSVVEIWLKFIDGWLVVRLKRRLPVPPIGEYKVEELKRLEVIG